MKNVMLKFVSLMMIIVLAMSSFACSKKGETSGHRNEKISEDAPWFDSEVVTIDLGINTGTPISSYSVKLVGSDEKNIVVFVDGEYASGADDTNSADESFAYLKIWNRVAKEITTVDLKSALDGWSYVENITYSDGKLTLKGNYYDSKTYDVTRMERDVDVESGNVLDTREISKDAPESAKVSFDLGEYEVGVDIQTDELKRGFGRLVVTSSKGNPEEIIIKEEGVDFYKIPIVLPLSESSILVPVITDDGNRFYELNLKTTEVRSLESKDYEWLDLNLVDELRDCCYGTDGKTYYTTPEGIAVIDTVNKKMENAIDYDWCGVNKMTLEFLTLEEADDNSFLLCGQKNANYMLTTNVSKQASEFYIVQLTKAPKNPHAGKTLLNLYTNGYVNATTYDAILKYNETSSDYYIVVTDKYDKANSYNDTAVNTSILNAGGSMSNELAMDIINGEGPDIFLNTSELGQLNNDRYLVDLTPYFSDLSIDKYFTNVVEASRFDGKLYQMPICFSVQGIVTDQKNAGSSGIGFTFEEYKEFVSGPMNGKDVLGTGQVQYFTGLFNGMNDKFIKDGKIDFTCDEFRELAKYVNDNVPDKAVTNDNADIDEFRTTYFGSFYGMMDYFSALAKQNGDVTLLGKPSSDGRGPMAIAYTSVAISADAADVNACVEFINILLSDEIQEELALSEHFVLNRSSFRDYGMLAVECFNGPYGDWMFDNSNPDNTRRMFSESDIDRLETIFLNCSRVSSIDPAINNILAEEMPAYFNGQKDLDAVIDIAQDRAQKVLNERG